MLLLPVKYHSVPLYKQAFSSYRLFCDMYTKWPHNGIEHNEVKGTQCVLLVSLSHKCLSVSLYDELPLSSNSLQHSVHLSQTGL